MTIIASKIGSTTTEIVSQKWTLSLVNILADRDSARFSELQRSLEGISPRTLTSRLRELAGEGFIDRHIYPEVPPRVEYSLTTKGQALLKLVEQINVYEREWAGTCFINESGGGKS